MTHFLRFDFWRDKLRLCQLTHDNVSREFNTRCRQIADSRTTWRGRVLDTRQSSQPFIQRSSYARYLCNTKRPARGAYFFPRGEISPPRLAWTPKLFQCLRGPSLAFTGRFPLVRQPGTNYLCLMMRNHMTSANQWGRLGAEPFLLQDST